MNKLFDIIRRGLNEDNAEIAPKLAVGIALFGAALVINALAPGSHDDRDVPPDYGQPA